MSRSSSRLLIASAALVAVGALSALARDGSLGDYEITSTEGVDARGTLTVAADLSVTRRVTHADGSIHTSSGKGRLAGATLTVAFDGTGEPRDLTGEWTLRGETDGGRYAGAATFGLHHGKWVAKYRVAFDDDEAHPAAVEIDGRFQGLLLVGQRRGPGEGDAAPVTSVEYALSPDGLTLTGTASGAKETFTRARLPQTGGPTATYIFEEDGKLSGTFSNGAKDKGARATVSKVATEPGARVEPDPVPSSLRAVRETSILSSAQKGASVVKAVRRNELVPVCGKEDGFWVVGPFQEQGQRRRWRGYVPLADLDDRLRYAEVPAPVFLPDRAPSATSVQQSDLGTCYLDAALIAIAAVRSTSIESMIKEHEDGTVSVRFYRRSGRSFAEEWVRIKKSIIVDERGRSHYTFGEGGQLWPALVEKAFAAWRGAGWYRNIEGGNAGDVFEVLLGLPARARGWDLGLPSELGQRGRFRRRGADGLQLGRDDLAAIARYRETDVARKETTALVDRPAARRDIAFIDSQIAGLRSAGLSEDGARDLHDHFAKRLDGPLGSGHYGPQAKEVYDLIAKALAAKLPICMSTRPWGSTPGTGQSGRENLQLVAGLASQHEYTVVGVHEDEHGLRWVDVVNPWHHFSRVYERQGDRLVARATNRRQNDHGAFAVELSDVLRYFDSVAYVEK